MSERDVRDVTDVLFAIYEFGRPGATTAEIREVVAWLQAELEDRGASSAPTEARRTSFALAAELLETAVWLSARLASPSDQRHLEVLQRVTSFLRGDSRGELFDVRHLIRHDAACAAIAAYVRQEERAVGDRAP